MLHWLSGLSPWVLIPVLVAVGVGLTIGLDHIIRHRMPKEARHSATQTAAVMLQVTATLYAILIGFVIVDEYSQLRNVQGVVADKASALTAIFENSRGLPEASGHEIRVATLAYAQTFVDHTFPALKRDTAADSTNANALSTLLTAVHSAAPTTPEQIASYDAMLTATNEALSSRQRILGSEAPTVPNALVWMLILIGFVVVVTATALDTQHRASHLLILSSMTMVIGITLALVISMDYAYGGIVRVNAAPIVTFIRTHTP